MLRVSKGPRSGVLGNGKALAILKKVENLVPNLRGPRIREAGRSVTIESARAVEIVSQQVVTLPHAWISGTTENVFRDRQRVRRVIQRVPDVRRIFLGRSNEDRRFAREGSRFPREARRPRELLLDVRVLRIALPRDGIPELILRFGIPGAADFRAEDGDEAIGLLELAHHS